MLKEILTEELKKFGIEVESSQIEIPKEEFGDLALPCFIFAKKLKKDPNEIAKEFSNKITSELIERMEVKSGYLNFFLNWKKILPFLKEIDEIDKWIGKEKKKIMVEHTSVNPNKAIHIGHARNACLGDVIAKMLKLKGNEVIVANYIDDTGKQVADLVLAFKYLNYPEESEIKFDNYCDKVYVETHKKLEKNPELQEKIKEISKLIEEGNNEIAIYARKLAEKVVKEQLKTLWNLNIFYDLLNWESDILKKKLWEKTFEFLKAKSLVERVETGRKKGCWILKLSKLKNFKNLKDADKVLIRSDGTLVYAAKDIAYAFWKHGILEDEFEYTVFCMQPNGKELWSTCEKGEKLNSKFNRVDVSINIIDARQSLEQEIVKNAIKLVNPKVNYIHYAYEVVSLSQKTAKKLRIEMDESKQFVHMSGRKGWFINVDTLYQKLFEKILEEVKKRNEGMEEKKCKEIAKKLTLSTIRYELLKVSPEKMIIFDLDEALSLEANTAIYLLYTYARACNILKKAEKIGKNFEVEKIEEGEKKLLKHLLLFPEILNQALKNLRPNEICNYIFTLANIFNNFYEKYPVLKSEKESFRLELVRKTKNILEFCFELLGIEKLERI